MPRVIHFEIHATDPKRLIEFYSAVFGWQVQQAGDMDYWLITTGPDDQPGINGAILGRGVPAPEVGTTPSAFVCTIQVDSLDDTMTAALAHGATEALPRMPVTGIGWVAYFIDPDGNVFGVLQPDPAAA